MAQRDIPNILATYRSIEPQLPVIASQCKDWLVQYLARFGLKYHLVTHRIKGLNSLSGKITAKPDSYSKLSEVTDLIGLRVITSLPNDVDNIARVISRVQGIDRINSVDKRKKLRPSVIGYQSAHYVIQVGEIITDNSISLQMKAVGIEIQIRSLLQHAWAENEHDKVYKAQHPVPFRLRRRMFSLSGALESADFELNRVIQEIEQKGSELIAAYNTKVEGPIDIGTIGILAAHPLVQHFDSELCWFYGTTPSIFDTYIASFLVKELGLAGVAAKQEALDVLFNEGDKITTFTQGYVDGRPADSMHVGISLAYVGYYLVAKTRDLAKIEAFLHAMWNLSAAEATQHAHSMIKALP
jgi:putative GTP pyrophosphokinase